MEKDRKNLEKKRSPVIAFLHIALILLSAVILSEILAFIVRETVGGEFVIAVLSFPGEINAPFPINVGGLLFLGFGFILVISGNFHLLFIGKIGLVDREPFHTPSTLVTSGPYQYSRNPIYFGVVLILLGWATITISLTIFSSAFALFLFFWRAFVRWEEEKLEETFGDEYREYKQRV